MSEKTDIKKISGMIISDGEESWKLWIFNFVDSFRKNPDFNLIKFAPDKKLSRRIQCLLASTVHALCIETKTKIPDWVLAIPGLEKPWFVAGYENLKAIALVESPVYFRQNNIFVLENFLSRT